MIPVALPIADIGTVLRVWLTVIFLYRLALVGAYIVARAAYCS
jgi:hypothetical protein